MKQVFSIRAVFLSRVCLAISSLASLPWCTNQVSLQRENSLAEVTVASSERLSDRANGIGAQSRQTNLAAPDPDDPPDPGNGRFLEDRAMLRELREEHAALKKSPTFEGASRFRDKWCYQSRRLIVGPGVIYETDQGLECKTLPELARPLVDAELRRRYALLLKAPSLEGIRVFHQDMNSFHRSLYVQASEELVAELAASLTPLQTELEYNLLPDKQLQTLARWIEEREPIIAPALRARIYEDVVAEAIARPASGDCDYLFSVQAFVPETPTALDDCIWRCTTALGTYEAYERYLRTQRGFRGDVATERANALDPRADFHVIETIFAPWRTLPRGANSVMKAEALRKVLGTRGSFKFRRFAVSDVRKSGNLFMVLGGPQDSNWTQTSNILGDTRIWLSTSSANAKTLLMDDVIGFDAKLKSVRMLQYLTFELVFEASNIRKQPKTLHDPVEPPPGH